MMLKISTTHRWTASCGIPGWSDLARIISHLTRARAIRARLDSRLSVLGTLLTSTLTMGRGPCCETNRHHISLVVFRGSKRSSDTPFPTTHGGCAATDRTKEDVPNQPQTQD